MEEEEHFPVPITVESLRRSSHSDWIALGLGALSFFVGFLVYPQLDRSAPPAVPASIALLLTAFLAGLVSGARAKPHEVPESVLAPSSIRWGGRTGLIAFLSGGGFMAIGLRASQLFGESPSGAPPGGVSASALCLSTLVILLPTVVAGAVGTYLALARGRSALPMPQTPPVALRSTPRARAGPVAALSVFILGILLSSLPAHSPKRAPETAPEFRHESPAGLAKAPAGRWRVVASRHIPGLSQSSLAAPSADGRFIAYQDENASGITVFNLRKASVERRFAMRQAAALAWSPGGDRLFCVAAHDSSCWVLTRSTGSATLLPIRGPLPFGSPRWKTEGEILFSQGSVDSGSLDLGTLRTRLSRPSGDSEPGSTAVPVSSVAETEKCRLTVRPRVHSFSTPLEAGTRFWEFQTSAVLSVEDKGRGRAFPLLGEAVPQGATFIVSPDASMITVLTPAGAVTHYVGLADELRHASLEVALPKLPDLAEDSRLATMTSSGRIGAFVCAPLVNPLTGKVIGPDPRRVKALGFCTGWGSGQGRLTIAESYAPIAPGDVAGYLHRWEDGQPSLLSGSDWEQWWSPAAPVSGTDADPPDVRPLWQKPELLAIPGGVGFHGWRPSADGDSRPPVTELGSLSAPPAKLRIPNAIPSLFRRDGGDAAKPKVEPAPTDKESGLEAVIRAFVTKHHAKVGAGDLEGFVADYAATVDFNDKGVVEADFIRRDQAAYLPKYDRLSETVVGPIQLTPVKAGWRADYTIRSFAVSRRDGKEHDRKVRITLEIGHYRGGVFQILKERAAVEN